MSVSACGHSGSDCFRVQCVNIESQFHKIICESMLLLIVFLIVMLKGGLYQGSILPFKKQNKGKLCSLNICSHVMSLC